MEKEFASIFVINNREMKMRLVPNNVAGDLKEYAAKIGRMLNEDHLDAWLANQNGADNDLSVFEANLVPTFALGRETIDLEDFNAEKFTFGNCADMFLLMRDDEAFFDYQMEIFKRDFKSQLKEMDFKKSFLYDILKKEIENKKQ